MTRNSLSKLQKLFASALLSGGTTLLPACETCELVKVTREYEVFPDVECAEVACTPSPEQCLVLCKQDTNVCEKRYDPDRIMVVCKDIEEVECTPQGRRPSGFTSAAIRMTNLGQWLASAATLEFVSIAAFEVFAADLRRFGAELLAEEALRSAEDERKHACTMAELARQFGDTEGERPVTVAPHARSLFEVALENAVEGCVRETFAALVMQWAAAHASNQKLAVAFSQIACDEMRHAALAWDAHLYFAQQLSPAQREVIDLAQRAECQRLIEHAHIELAEFEHRLSGLPRQREMQGLVDHFATQLFATMSVAA